VKNSALDASLLCEGRSDNELRCYKCDGKDLDHRHLLRIGEAIAEGTRYK